MACKRRTSFAIVSLSFSSAALSFYFCAAAAAASSASIALHRRLLRDCRLLLERFLRCRLRLRSVGAKFTSESELGSSFGTLSGEGDAVGVSGAAATGPMSTSGAMAGGLMTGGRRSRPGPAEPVASGSLDIDLDLALASGASALAPPFHCHVPPLPTSLSIFAHALPAID